MLTPNKKQTLLIEICESDISPIGFLIIKCILGEVAMSENMVKNSSNGALPCYKKSIDKDDRGELIKLPNPTDIYRGENELKGALVCTINSKEIGSVLKKVIKE